MRRPIDVKKIIHVLDLDLTDMQDTQKSQNAIRYPYICGAYKRSTKVEFFWNGPPLNYAGTEPIASLHFSPSWWIGRPHPYEDEEA